MTLEERLNEIVEKQQGDAIIPFPVSYTHLDVYKRQTLCMRQRTSDGFAE